MTSVVFLLSFFYSQVTFGSEPAVFKLYLTSEITTVDPAQVSGNEANYFYSNLFTGLYKYNNKLGLIPEGAKACKFENTKKIICELNDKIKWSDGSQVTAEHYVQAFRHIIDPAVKSRESELLLKLKNAKKIIKEELEVSQLGIIAISNLKLQFDFDETDNEFLYKLASVNLTPWKTLPKKDLVLANGPYVLSSWEKNKPIKLVKNKFYPLGNSSRPDLEVYLVPEDSTALNMYDFGKINFVRMIPTNLVDKYKSKPGYFENSVARFDYIGFGPQLKNNEELRKALSLASNYEEFKTLFHSVGRPGCPAFSQTYIDKWRCFDYNLEEARKLKQIKNEMPKMVYSLIASSPDLTRGAEWYQNQWKKNLGIEIELREIERGAYTQFLTHSPPAIFWRGVTLTRPTCLAALELFQSDSTDNLIHFKSEKYDQIIKKFETSQDPKTKRKLCGEGVQLLLDSYALIPQGPFNYFMIIDPHFKGWEMNEMNQLDLANLRYDP